MHARPETAYRKSSTAVQPSLQESEISAFLGTECEETTDVSGVTT
jgi:hypothetical protein